jgi:RNA polymerase sigma-70 factor (ECF subfamily)
MGMVRVHSRESNGERPHALDAEALFRLHAGFVARFLFRLGVPAEALDDLVQDTFLVVHRDGGYRRAEASPTTYLASIAVRLNANRRRRERTRLLLRERVESEQSSQRPDTPLQVLEASESMGALQAAIDALKEDLRVVLVLADLEQESCAAIAAGLGVPLGTVHWRLHEARKQFAKAVRKNARTYAPVNAAREHREAP